jgi:integrase
MRPVVTFAYVTGWRINSEVLTIQWRQVDLRVGEVRLDPGTTKNREGRLFYLTPELQQLMKEQRASADEIQRQKNMIVQHVFFHRRSPRRARSGTSPATAFPDVASTRLGDGPGLPPGAPAVFRTTSVGRRSATWSGRAFRSAWP